jgi:Glycosyl transferase family 2
VATLSAVIPATDLRATLGRVVAAIERARARPEEVVVVDRPAELGAAAARNRGAFDAAGDVIVFVDADVEVHEDAFERIRAAFAGDSELAAVFGSYDDDPQGGSVVSDFRNLLHHFVHHRGAGPATTFWTGLGAIRREAFVAAGGFDEGCRWLEDVELGMRLRRGGARILLDPAIQGKHLKRWTLLGMLKSDLMHRAVPWLRLMFENRSSSSALNLSWRDRVATGASALLAVNLVRRDVRAAALTTMLVIAIDAEFYGFLHRRGGLRLLAVGVPLHVAHRIVSVAAVPLAVTAHLLERAPVRG